MTQSAPQRRFSASTNDFVITDHESWRQCVVAMASIRGKTVGRLGIMARVGVGIASFADGDSRSVSVTQLLTFMRVHGFALVMRAPEAAEDGSEDLEVRSGEELVGALLKLVDASGNSISALATVSKAGGTLNKFLGGTHPNAQLNVLWRAVETLEISCRVISVLGARRTR